MQLSDMLDSLEGDAIVKQLQRLSGMRVSISWWGERLVSIRGYEGAVPIHKLAMKYLEAPAFHPDADAGERLGCYNITSKIDGLYQNSDKLLSDTLLYRYLVPSWEECRRQNGVNPRKHYQNSKKHLLEFSRERFQALFPGKEPLEVISRRGIVTWKAAYNDLMIAGLGGDQITMEF